MANSFISRSQQVEELINLYKDTTIEINHNLNYKFKANSRQVIESIISPKNDAKKSKRLFKKFKKSPAIVEILQEEEVIQNNEEDRADLLGKFAHVELPTKPHADEDLEILTQVITVDPFKEGEEEEEEVANSSVDELSEINMCNINKPTSKMPKIAIRPLQHKKRSTLNALKKRKTNVKPSFNHFDEVKQSNRLTARSRTQPVKESETIVKPNKKSKTTRFTEAKNQTSSSNSEENRSGSHSKNKDDCTETHKRFTCTVCDKSFQYKSAMSAHKASHTGSKPFICDHCPSRFAQKSHLTRHSFINHTKNSKIFKCPTCKVSFSQNHYLQVHMRVHSGAKPYTCGECSKNFSQKSHLNTHIKSHQEKCFACDMCSSSFTLKHHLLTHLKKVHKFKDG